MSLDIIRSCSFPGFDPAHVVASAEATTPWFSEAGFPEVQVLPGVGEHPAVIASDRRLRTNVVRRWTCKPPRAWS